MSTLVLTNASSMVESIRRGQVETPFVVTAVVTFPFDDIRKNIAIRDNTGSVSMMVKETASEASSVSLGDQIRAIGRIRTSGLYNLSSAVCTNVRVLAHGPLPLPLETSAQSILDGSCRGQLVSIRGTVIDSFRDDIDTRMFFLVLDCNRETICALIASPTDISGQLRELHNAEIRIVGICSSGRTNSYRHLSGYFISVYDLNGITVINRACDLFSAPELVNSAIHDPTDVRRLGRQRSVGKVIAVAQRNKLLLKNARREVTAVNLADGEPLPAYGQTIEAVGFAETDSYRVNLVHGIWRPSTNRVEIGTENPQTVSARDILTDGQGRMRVNPLYHGETIALVGKIKEFSPVDSQAGSFETESDGFPVTVDASSVRSVLTDLRVGCTVSMTGTCLINIDPPSSHSPFPRTRGFTVVLRTPDDMTIISTPPWWTVGRLLIVIVVIAILLVAILIWNRILFKLVEKRSRQLMKEEIAHAETDLRAEERARLSVELHDTIAQNLTGVSLQLDSVQLAAECDPAALPKYIETARLSLNSCRQNLRNCLRDLRSRVCEEKSLADAIAKTLAPHKGTADVTIDCPLRTQNSSENAIHAILCIIRELVINAINHGLATKINVVGRRETDGLSFDIRDNGHGFDPVTAPGIADGHFGLQGVRERVRSLQGTFELTSKSGDGTTIRIRQLQTGF